MAEHERQCSNPECRVGETGKCVEGFALDKCPHFGEPPEAPLPQQVSAADDQPEIEVPMEGVPLPSGERLTTLETGAVLRAGQTRVIAVVGPTAAGKTSLVATLYDLFQGGSVANLQFARSRTLLAFERACHHARAASQRNAPHTERTLVGGVAFYHLGLRDSGPGEALDLILADRAGEDYRSATDDPNVATTFIEIRRADVITILVDGQRLLDTGARHNVRSETEMLLQALIDGDGITQGQRVALVLTKMDALAASTQKAQAERDFHNLTENARRLFGETFGEMRSFQVAASPTTDVLPRGYGVPELLHFWVSATAMVDTRTVSLPWRLPERAFGRLVMLTE